MLIPTNTNLVLRNRDPDQLDHTLRINSSLGWFGFAALSLTIVAALIYSFVGTAPIKVSARGMLLSSLGITEINSTGFGRVTALKVQVGDKVRQGDVVATIGQFDTVDKLRAKELELGGYREERGKLIDFQSQVLAAQNKLSYDRRMALETRVASLGERIESLLELERNTRTMVEKGNSVRVRLLEATRDRSLAQDEAAQARTSLLQLIAESEAQITQNAREILNVDLKIAEAERTIQVLEGQLQRAATVYASTDGTIVEAAVSQNDLVQQGTPLMRMLPAREAGQLQAVMYVSANDGKRVRPGMAVEIIPANARLQRDGYIEAKVVEVSDLPATRESMLRVLKNDGLVTQLTAKGPPYEIIVALERDAESPTGFRWSTGRGLPNPPESGTIAEAKFVVDRIPLIALAVPRAETVLVSVQGLFR